MPLESLATYKVDSFDAETGVICVLHDALPAAGQGFYYLVSPNCSTRSWQTTLGVEPGRDDAVP